MSRLVLVGSVVVDLVMTVDALPEPGGDVLASSAALTAGGGLNVVVAAARDGMPVLFAGRHGTGRFGEVVAEALAASGAQVVHPPVEGVDSGFCVALVDATGERTFVTHVGAEGALSGDDLARVDLLPDDVVLCSGYSLTNPATVGGIAAWLAALPAGVRLLTDPSPLVAAVPDAVWDAVLGRTDVLTANRREAALMSGADDPALAAGVLGGRVRPSGAVLVRDGEHGCWVRADDGPAQRVEGFAVTAVDTSGAGDAHTGVLAAGLARGLLLRAAVRRAGAAAALAVTRPGPATAPTAAETDALLARSPR